MGESMHYVLPCEIELELAFEASIVSMRFFDIGEHGHYFAKRNEKNEENEGLRIVESTWQVAEGFHFAFCSSVLSPEGKDEVGGKREQSAYRRDVPRSSTMSPNDP
ncbi:hypothetical protein H5410_002028 [Solanum commersonii]|uniref:Uncharacterized protein n=1 Tax=Solanum commersonii TaxID=4109 RepID=A0A9J6B1R0_SOLCO|nr:hypothetical protein H5410_002028 [Solanum commersonii]